jgi:hypothetical protein
MRAIAASVVRPAMASSSTSPMPPRSTRRSTGVGTEGRRACCRRRSTSRRRAIVNARPGRPVHRRGIERGRGRHRARRQRRGPRLLPAPGPERSGGRGGEGRETAPRGPTRPQPGPRPGSSGSALPCTWVRPRGYPPAEAPGESRRGMANQSRIPALVSMESKS